MPCIKFDFTISNDRDGRLRKSVMYAAANNEVVDHTKATLFAGLIQTEGFEKYVKQELEKSGQTFTNLADINANTMRKYLREYYDIHHTNVDNTIAKEQVDALNGFTSSNAKNDAISYTSDIILDVYDTEMTKPREERLSYKQMIVRVRNLLQQYLRNDVFKEVVRKLKDEKYSNNATIQERLNKYENAYNSFVNAVNEYKIFISNPKNKNTNKAKELLNTAKELDRQYTIIASNLVRDYKSLTGDLNGQELNFLNLVEQTERQPKKWFTLAFQNQRLTSLVNSGRITDTFNFCKESVYINNGVLASNRWGDSRAQRTFMGTNGKAGDIWLCVSDGRYNDGESAGLTYLECGQYLQTKGCIFALPLDGGGSSTMVFEGEVLNAEKGHERAVVDFVYFR